MQKALKALGLSTYESRAIEALFKKEYTLKELSKAAGIPPGKVYSVAKQLIDKGMLQCSDERPKKLYVPHTSGLISKLIKDYEHQQDKVISVLKSFATESDAYAGKNTPFFDIGTNLEDNKRIQLRTFTEAEKEVLQILNVHHQPNSNRHSKTLWEKEIEKALARGVRFKAIYPKTTILPKLLEKLSKRVTEKFSVRRLDTDFIRCDIIDSKKVLLKLVHEDPLQFGGVLFIENRALAENLKNIFFRFWEEAE